MIDPLCENNLSIGESSRLVQKINVRADVSNEQIRQTGKPPMTTRPLDSKLLEFIN
jgi:hypothetical protein